MSAGVIWQEGTSFVLIDQVIGFILINCEKLGQPQPVKIIVDGGSGYKGLTRAGDPNIDLTWEEGDHASKTKFAYLRILQMETLSNKQAHPIGVAVSGVK